VFTDQMLQRVPVSSVDLGHIANDFLHGRILHHFPKLLQSDRAPTFVQVAANALLRDNRDHSPTWSCVKSTGHNVIQQSAHYAESIDVFSGMVKRTWERRGGKGAVDGEYNKVSARKR
jgi:hypothetical protein